MTAATGVLFCIVGFLFGDSVNTSDDPHVPESVLTTSIFNRAYKSNKTGECVLYYLA